MTGILVSTAVQMIRSRVRLERAQMDMLNRELTQARQIQIHWLPRQPTDLKHLDVAAVNMPASHVSGDFYNWFELPDGRIVVMIGDVTGHGMAAAFLMATTQLLVRTTMPGLCDPGACLAEVNRQLCVQVFNGQFVTMLVMVIDIRRNRLEVATAGHPPPLIGTDGRFKSLEVEPQLVLGIEPDLAFPTQRFPLRPGTSMLLYTDGVCDATAEDGARFGLSSLTQTFSAGISTARSAIDTVLNAISTFRGGQELADDLTMVAIRLKPSPAAPSKVPSSAAAVHRT
jgi:sigma-B regulation protein RsbU (phosphoserine phosphatase)